MARYKIMSSSQLLQISNDEQITREQINDQARLARELSNIKGIVGITFNHSEIIITKAKTSEWDNLIPQITPLVEAFYAPTIPSAQLER